MTWLEAIYHQWDFQARKHSQQAIGLLSKSETYRTSLIREALLPTSYKSSFNPTMTTTSRLIQALQHSLCPHSHLTATRWSWLPSAQYCAFRQPQVSSLNLRQKRACSSPQYFACTSRSSSLQKFPTLTWLANLMTLLNCALLRKAQMISWSSRWKSSAQEVSVVMVTSFPSRLAVWITDRARLGELCPTTKSSLRLLNQQAFIKLTSQDTWNSQKNWHQALLP